MVEKGVPHYGFVMVGYCILEAAVFICDFGIEDQFLGVLIQRFSLVLQFTEVNPLALNYFTDLCDELAGSLEACFIDSYVSEISLLCTCKGFRNETYNYRCTSIVKNFRV